MVVLLSTVMKFFHQMRLRSKLLAGFAVPALFTLALTALIIYSLNRMDGAFNWVEHTHVAIGYGDKLQSSMVDAETGLKGYLIAGEAAFLEPYVDGKAVFAETLAKAQKHVSDNPAQLERLDQIGTLKSAWYGEHAAPAIALRQQVNEGAAIAARFRVMSARTDGKQAFDAFRVAISSLHQQFESAGEPRMEALLTNILLAMVNQETGQRGFLLTGLEESLEPYVQGQADFNEHAANLTLMLDQSAGAVDVAAARIALTEAVSLASQWRRVAADPEIEIRREKNQYPQTINDVAAFIGRGLGKQYMDELRVVVEAFANEEKALIEVRTAEASKISAMSKVTAIVGGLIALLASIAMVLLITRIVGRQLGTEPGTMEGIAEAIARGDLSQDLTSSQPATGVFAAMQRMQANLLERDQQDKESAAQMRRVSEALNNASAAVLVADATGEIIYQNHAAARMFEAAQVQMTKVLSGFSVSKVVGSSLDVFRRPGGATLSELGSLQASLQQDSEYGELTLRQTYSPILDEQGNRLGVVVEWLDRTEQLAVEKEIEGLVDSALAGDLTQRLNLENSEGFNKMLGERMNALVSGCESVLNDTIRVFEALSVCDLTQTISADYQGAFGRLRDHANQTVAQLTQVIGKVKVDAATLDTASQELSSLNSDMYNTAQKSSDQARSVSAATEQITANITGVASAATQMSASINEIARNSSDASRIAAEAVKLAESTESTVRQLSVSSSGIGAVVKVINSIAEQTNLLALNATIEAARAGDAGKGFAVVANEVKELAKETAKATEEIEQRIAAIQTDSESAVDEIGGIDKIIRDINAIQGVISTAVAEQSSVTQLISRSVNEAADGSSDIASSSALAVEGAKQSLESTEKAQHSTHELSGLAGELRTMVDNFHMES